MVDITEISKTMDWALECGMDEETRKYFSEHESELEKLYLRLKMLFSDRSKSAVAVCRGLFGKPSADLEPEELEELEEEFQRLSTWQKTKLAFDPFLTIVVSLLGAPMIAMSLALMYGALCDNLSLTIVARQFLGAASIVALIALYFLVRSITDHFAKFNLKEEMKRKKASSLELRQKENNEVIDFNKLELKKNWKSTANIAKLESALKSWISWKLVNDHKVVASSRDQVERQLNVKVWFEPSYENFDLYVRDDEDFCFAYEISLDS